MTLSLWIYLQAFLHLHNMKKLLIPISFVLFACSNDRTFKKAEDAQDAGREFIRASLDGDYEKAQFYLLADTTNQILMNKWKKDFEKLDESTKKQYKDADILPIAIQALNDSVTSYTFSNSFKRDTTTIKIVRSNGEWLVDLKEILNSKK